MVLFQNPLQDAHGRRFSYLRLSITDACNFRCVYCLPNGYSRQKDAEDYLSVSEILNLTQAFSELGTWKVRLTGGEPTLRRDLLDIVRAVASVNGIRKVALSTNGNRLKSLARPLFQAGVSALNISIDSLDPQKFSEMTGTTQLSEVLEGIEVALKIGFESIKVNAVLMGGLNDNEVRPFMDWIRNKPISVRFIELMPTSQNKALFAKHHIKSSEVRNQLLEEGWAPVSRGEADGPAIEYSHPEYLGRMGIIAPYSHDFCGTCNRLRVTSQGQLRLCLFAEGNNSLRKYLQAPSQKDELKAHLHRLLLKKEISHYLPAGKLGNNQSFSAMGG